MSRTLGGEMAATTTNGSQTGNGHAAQLAAVLPGIDGRAPVQISIANVNIAAVNLGGAPASAVTTTPPAQTDKPAVKADTLVEKMVPPTIDADYSNRKGYQKNFLGIEAPLPDVTDKTLVAKLEDGSYLIPYEHFSVALNKKRRLALFTASNVDASPSRKKPEPGSYSRAALTGLGPNDREQWVIDERIPSQYQIPDYFYNEDRTAFDKGRYRSSRGCVLGDGRERR